MIMGLLSPAKAWANYDKTCEMRFEGYTSPSLDGCIIQADSKGNLKFKLHNRIVGIKTCLKSLGLNDSELNQFETMAEEFKVAASEVTTLLVKEHNGAYSAKMAGNSSFQEGLEFPPLEKNYNGVARGILDNGLSIELKLKKRAHLKISGDFGRLSLAGTCTKYDSGSSEVSSEGISSLKLDKAAVTCSELGFKAGTEKHGDCVLKLLDQ